MLAGVVASNNINWGIRLSNSTNNTLAGITASNNSSVGVYLDGSSNNSLCRDHGRE